MYDPGLSHLHSPERTDTVMVLPVRIFVDSRSREAPWLRKSRSLSSSFLSVSEVSVRTFRPADSDGCDSDRDDTDPYDFERVILSHEYIFLTDMI